MPRKMPLLLAGLLLATGVLGLLLTIPRKHAFRPLGPGMLRQSEAAVARVESTGIGRAAEVAPGPGGSGSAGGAWQVAVPDTAATTTPTPTATRVDASVSAAGRALVPALQAATATEETPATPTPTATATATPITAATPTPTPMQTVVVPQKPYYVPPTTQARTPTVTQPQAQGERDSGLPGVDSETPRGNLNTEP